MSLDEVSRILGKIEADLHELKERGVRLELAMEKRTENLEFRVRGLEKALIGLSAVGGFLLVAWEVAGHFLEKIWK